MKKISFYLITLITLTTLSISSVQVFASRTHHIKIHKVKNNKHTHYPKKTKDIITDGLDENKMEVIDYNTFYNKFKVDMLNDINKYRIAHESPALSIDNNLESIAQQRAVQTFTNFSHYDSNGQPIASRIASQMGLSNSNLSENLAKGDYMIIARGSDNPQITADNVMETWIKEAPSGGHYLNMINPNNKKIGIGLYINPKTSEDVADHEEPAINYAEDYTD